MRNATNLVDFEHDVETRKSARELGFEDLPGTREDTMSDLNIARHADSVDSLSGSESASTADELVEYDTITDSNTLTSAATIGSVYGLPNTPRAYTGRRDGKTPMSEPEALGPDRFAGEDADYDDVDYGDGELAERYETDRKFSPEDEAMGMRDVPDDETVRGYIEANEKELRARKESRASERRDPADDRGAPPRMGRRDSDEGRLH